MKQKFSKISAIIMMVVMMICLSMVAIPLNASAVRPQ